MPQYNLQWNNFYTSSNFLKINLYLKDNKQGGDVNVFLRFRLERVGVSIINSPDFIATKPIKLSFGSLQTLTGIDISENFLPQNLLLQGISEGFVRNGGSLPDGLWTIYVTAYEADGSRGYRQISNEGVGQTMVFYGQPPMLLSPGNGSEIDNSFSPNVLFNWLPRAGAGVGGLSGIAYKFELWELDTEEDPNEVVAGKRPIFSSTVSSPMYLYDASKPFLVTGKRYAWRVQVIDASGNNKYENDGYSEVWAFRYGLLCGEVKKIALSPIGGRFYRLGWESVKNSNKYEINWRVKGGSSWTIETSIENRFDFQLDDSQNYEFKVRSLCRNGETGAWSQVLEWSKDVVNTSKSSATGISTTTTTSNPEDDLSKVLNPLGTTVTSSDKAEPGDITTVKTKYNTAPTYKLNRCGMPVKSTTASCEVDQSIDYKGTIDFPNPPKATMLYFNAYEIIVTGGNAQKGEGLLFFPYLMKRIPVEWENITIRKGEDPEDPLMKDYGCIVGPQDKIQVQGSDASVLSEDLDKQFTALAAWLNDPGSFTGTFGEAIEETKRQAKVLLDKIASGQLPTVEELGKYKSVCKALKKGMEAWKGDIQKQFPSPTPPEVAQVLSNVAGYSTQLQDLLDCKSTGYNYRFQVRDIHGGPNADFDENNFVVLCNIQAGQDVAENLLKDLDKLKEILVTDDENTPLALIKAIKRAKENAKKDVNLGTIIIKSVDKKWTPKTKTLPDLGDHRDYLQVDGLTLPTGKKLSWIQVSANEAVWDKKAPSPHELGVNVEYEERDLKTPGKTGLMFKNASSLTVFWIIVKDNELNILKDYLLGSAFGLEIVDVALLLTKDLKKDITLIVKDGTEILDDDKNQTAYISSTPEMPKISIELKTTNTEYTDDLAVRFSIKYQRFCGAIKPENCDVLYPNSGIGDERKATTMFPINAMSKGAKFKNGSVWVIDYDGKFRGGDALVEIISISNSTVVKEYKFKILGKNPDLSDVYTYVEGKGYVGDYWFFKRIIKHEAGVTEGKAQQFEAKTNTVRTKGYPRFGGPYGFGLGQIDNYNNGVRCSQQDIWNWKSNIDKIHLILDEKKGVTKKYDFGKAIEKLKPIFDLDPENVLPCDDQVEGDFTVIYAPSTQINGFDTENKFLGVKKDVYPSVSLLDANVIRRYNGGSYVTMEIKKVSSVTVAQWGIDRYAESNEVYYVEEIGKIKE